jgi:hypothetical protein
VSGAAAIWDWLPTWIRATLWLAAAAIVDGLFNALTTGQIKVDPVWVPIINVLLVAVRDFIRSRTQPQGA